MLDPLRFTSELERQGFSFFTGVPDSLLKELCACITERLGSERHIIAANEGGAVGLATGYHLASGGAAVVYMQNSGIGNAVNPLLSLADPAVYGIPMLLIVGWRGQPGTKDEPQHLKQGRIQEALLHALEYRFELLANDFDAAAAQLQDLTEHMHRNSTPVVLVVEKDTFGEYKQRPGVVPSEYPLTREDALRILLSHISPDDLIVSTTGKTSREIYELREAAGQTHERDFLTVGSMGHALMIAVGLARHSTARVFCVDGDGAALMHMGGLAIAAKHAPENLHHIVINNGVHDSVGGQPTVGFSVPFPAIARELGYRVAYRAESATELRTAMESVMSASGPTLVEIRVSAGARPNLGRPTTTPQHNKAAFMKGLQ